MSATPIWRQEPQIKLQLLSFTFTTNRQLTSAGSQRKAPLSHSSSYGFLHWAIEETARLLGGVFRIQGGRCDRKRLLPCSPMYTPQSKVNPHRWTCGKGPKALKGQVSNISTSKMPHIPRLQLSSSNIAWKRPKVKAFNLSFEPSAQAATRSPLFF